MGAVKDDKIAPINCLWCGKKIPDSRRGHGHPPKTCSEACRKARASQREKERYAAVKNSDAWKSTRAAYLLEFRRRLEADPEFAEMVRAQSVDRVRSSRAKRAPERIEQERENGRRWYREFRRKLESNPRLLAQFQAHQRAWYHSLSQEDKARIYGGYNRRKALNELLAVGEALLEISKNNE